MRRIVKNVILAFLQLLILSRTSGGRIQHISNHTNNAAIILQSSVFFHNYRHTTNALSVYHSLKNHGGFTDDNIILFLADEIPCNARNTFKNKVFANHQHDVDLYENTQVDYSGDDVTVSNFLRVLKGRHVPNTPASQKLPNLNEHTNLLIYITGHGGDEFFKFRDKEELTAKEFRLTLEEMQFRKRFQSVLFISDTCQAFTFVPNTRAKDEESSMPNDLTNVYTIGTSLKDQNSYSHHADMDIGHSVQDRYTFNLMQYMNKRNKHSGASKWATMEKMSVKSALVNSMFDRNGQSLLGFNTDIGWSDYRCDTSMDKIPLSDFMVMRQGHSSRNGSVIKILELGVEFDANVIHGNTDFNTKRLKSKVETDKENIQEQQSFGGSNPNDPIFLVSVFVFVLTVIYTSNLWQSR